MASTAADAYVDGDVEPRPEDALRDRPTRMDYVLFSAAPAAHPPSATATGAPLPPPAAEKASFDATLRALLDAEAAVRAGRRDGYSLLCGARAHLEKALDRAPSSHAERLLTATSGGGRDSSGALDALGIEPGEGVEGCGPAAAGGGGDGPWKPASCRVVRWRTRAGLSVSDHFGVTATFAFDPRAAGGACARGAGGHGVGGIAAAPAACSTARRAPFELAGSPSPPSLSSRASLPPSSRPTGAAPNAGAPQSSSSSALDREVAVLQECQQIIVEGLADAQRRRTGHTRRAKRALFVMVAYSLLWVAGVAVSPGLTSDTGVGALRRVEATRQLHSGGLRHGAPEQTMSPLDSAASSVLFLLGLSIPLLGVYATVELLLSWFAVGDEISGFEEVREQMEVCCVYRRAMRSAGEAAAPAAARPAQGDQ